MAVNPKDAYEETSEIIQFLQDGERSIRISRKRDIILALGVTGSGKSTLTQFVTGNDEHLRAVEQGEGSEEFIIEDLASKVCQATTDSCTTVPDLIVDRDSETPVYDCPGFADTRHVKNDLSVSYFIKKIIENADTVKLVLVVSYPAVRRGVDRQQFMSLVKHSLKMVKDLEKFKKSIALIVTKVDNQYSVRKGIPILIPDKIIIANIALFLEEVKANLERKISQNAISHSDHIEMSRGIQLINILLAKDHERIGIFRRPDEAGKLTTPMMLQNKKSLAKIIHQNIAFTPCDTDDFGYTVSAETINKMHGMVDTVNRKISDDLGTIAREIEEGFLVQERDINDVVSLYDKFHFGFEGMRNITAIKANDPLIFLGKIRETADILKIDVSRTSIDRILHYDKFLKFMHTLSGISTAKPLEWVESLTSVVHSFDDSQKWYHFLINLQSRLLRHDVQKKLSRNSTIMDDLRKHISAYYNDASAVKENLKQFLGQVYKESDKEYHTIKDANLNSWKLKFLKDMLDFQTQTFCKDNKLVVTGNYVHMSDVVQKKCPGAQLVEIYALSKIFVDADFDRTGAKVQLSIIAPVWDVIGSPRIVLDGKSGQDHELKASDGAWSGADGNNGLPGLPGGAAGNFFGFAWNCNNCQFLTVTANGGRGGAGQDGGNGVKGKGGQRPNKANTYKNVFNILIVTVSHEDKGNRGQEGGNGGLGGAGGNGGASGKVTMFTFAPNSSVPKSSAENGPTGHSGHGGKGGDGGESELIVESNTYILGMKAWGNGNVFHQIFSASGGETPNSLNHDDMKDPEPPVDTVNPSHPLNNYKAYLRENLDKSLSRPTLEEFYEHLETSKEVINLYDTLGLVNDLQCLENQYAKLHHRMNLLPYYKHLIDKIEEYAKDTPYAEITGQYRKVRAFLYMSTLSKICTIENNLSNDLVINVKDFLGVIVDDVEQLLKDFMVARERNRHTAAFRDHTRKKIAEAYNFIKRDIMLETDNILAELDKQIAALVLETHHLQDVTRRDLNKMNNHMLTRGISAVLRVASRALDFFGLLSLATEGVIEGTNLISDTLSLDDVDSPLDMIGSLTKTVDGFLSTVSNEFKEKIGTFLELLFDVDKLLGVDPALNETKTFLVEKREEFVDLAEDPDPDWEKVDTKRGELVEFLQGQKKSMAELVQEDPHLEKAIKALDDSEQLLKLPEGVFNMMKQNKINNYRSEELEVVEKLKQLEEYETQIYSIIVPLCKKLNDQFKVNFGEDSHVALDVEKWKIQNALSDINFLLSSMTQEFQVHGAILATVEKLKFGISTMIQVYDRIQDYRDEAALADYMEAITSNNAKDIEVTDVKLRNAMDELKVILKTNLILADYEKAMNAFGQHVFPFAKAYMQEYDLPASLRVMNSTDDLLNEAIYRINSIERKLVTNELVINKSLDDHVFPDVKFGDDNPFYVWKYETHSHEISQLLQGGEVLLNADITEGVKYNSVKFNEIGLAFKFGNNATQNEFDLKMKNFRVEMNHFGMSYYRCGNKFYVMTHDSQKIQHSVNNNDGFERYNTVYEKMSKNEPLLSPYTMWSVKLHNDVGDGFDVLANHTQDIIDLALVGRGMYVTREIDRTVCDDRLDRYYKVDQTVNEVPNVDYRIDVEEHPIISDRRRRSVDGMQEDGLVFNPLKKIYSWFKGITNTYNDEPTELPDEPTELPYVPHQEIPLESSPQYAELPYAGFVDSDPSRSVNYDLVASQNNLLLLDLIMRLKTGAKPPQRTTSVDFMDDDYAHNMAYSAYAPKAEEEIVVK